MTVERALRLIAGTFVTASVILGFLHSPYWFYFTAFVGLNLFQSGITDWCPMVTILKKAGLPTAAAAPCAAKAAAPVALADR